MRRLVTLGCDVDQVDGYGRYPIEVATDEGHGDKIECLVDAGAHANYPSLHSRAKGSRVLDHYGTRDATLKSLDRLSMRARGKPASAAMPEAAFIDGFNRLMNPTPHGGFVHARQWECQLKMVEAASVKQLRGIIEMAGGSDQGLFEKSELRERARTLVSAKLAEASAATPPTS